MATMKMKTKNKTDINKKPRIYFTCHPDDFDNYFEKISNDIFSIYDCVIYYTEDMTEEINEKDKEFDIGRNNLFVIPVTSKLLTTPNRAMDDDLPYALKSKIPVLPIMLETGLDEIYSRPDKFGELQYLNTISSDATEIPYEIKLKKYLEAVLISDETAKRIRAAFDAYIFLSYRKKDRHYANELMRLIHSNPECRDIAIWFDEFLTPGESFKENIEKILDDCELFTLLVTPQLFEKVKDKNGEERDNYVISTELPLAREKKEQKGTEIFAVEMEKTDKKSLSAVNIADCVDAKDEEGFRLRLLDAVSKIAFTENDGNDEHNFLIGLAYLDGIDVEVDRDRAVNLITDAAENNLPEAMLKLIFMYSDGIGVTRDTEKAQKWSERLSDYYFNSIFNKKRGIKSKRKLSELFSHYADERWEYVIKSFLLRTDRELPLDTIKTLYGLIMSLGICEYTLFFETCNEMQIHKHEIQIILVTDILLKSSNGTYPPYGPLFWYISEYELYEELLFALTSMQENEYYTNALALTRDVCWIFGHYNSVSEASTHIDGNALFEKAKLSGIRKGLCELFFTGHTDSTVGCDIYPRCFNIEEAKSWYDTGCGIYGRMSTAFEDELELYSHDSFTQLGDEFIGIASAKYDIELIESILNTKSCKKLCGLFLTPSENTEMQELSINSKHIRKIYAPENLHTFERFYGRKNFFTIIDNGIIYFHTKVILPTGITTINPETFYNYSEITSIILPDSLTKIGWGTFENCSSLAFINLPKNLTKIGEAAFKNCSSITSIIFPNSITKIEDETFFGCTSLSSIILSENLTEIEWNAFENCNSLTSIIFPDSIRKIKSESFCGCSSLASVIFSKNLIAIGESAFKNCNSLASVILPNGITEIESELFCGCSSLVSIILPEPLKEIGASAFKNCSSLTSIRIPDNVKIIGKELFSGCNNLKLVDNCPKEYSHKDLYLSPDCVISYRKKAISKIVFPANITEIQTAQFVGQKDISKINIPNSVTKIKESAFENCSSLTSITFPDNLTKIEMFAFKNCCSLVSVTLPKNLKEIGWYTFENCTSLKSITLPENITALGEGIFKNCTSLTSIILPDSLTEIELYAFENCSSLTSIKFPDNVVNIGKEAFIGCHNLKTIENCPIGYSHEDLCLSPNCTILYREKAIQKIEIPEDITEISSAQFIGRKDITQINIPNSVVKINQFAFKNCTTLKSVVFSKKLTEIDSYAFENCSSLTSISLPENLEKIGSYSFKNCTSLTSIIFPTSLTKIIGHSFKNCNSITSVMLPTNLQYLGNSTFCDCTSLTSIILPEKLTLLHGGTFNNCISLTSIELPENLTKIEWSTFENCSSLISIVLPDALTKIEADAFKNCSSLTEITIPMSVRVIGNDAFANCTGLREITISRRFEEDLPRIFSDVDLSQVKIYWL